MTSSTIIDTKTTLMSDLLREGRYCVPWHQRYYDWDAEKEVRDFLADIDEAAVNKRECHFLGSVMLVEQSPGVWEINDGQQRFVTFSLACARLCRMFTGEINHANERLVMSPLFDIPWHHSYSLVDADNLTPRLTPPQNDKSNFHLLIRGRDVGVNGKMTAAWREMNEFFSNMSPQAAAQFCEFMMGKLEVSCLYVPARLDLNSIFESLNARGKQLEDVDLIRNHLYSFFNAETEIPRRATVHEALEKTWGMLKSNTSGRKVHAPVGKYARCFFQCEFGPLPERRFYRTAKARIMEAIGKLPTQAKGADYAFHLVLNFATPEKIGIFRTIALPARHEEFVYEFIKKSGTTRSRRNLKHFLHEMREYTVTQPVLFALLSRYAYAPVQDKKEWGKFAHTCAEWLTSFVMRVALTGKFEPSVHESEFALCAQRLMTLKSPDYNMFAKFLQERDEKMGVIDDQAFIDKVTRVEMRTHAKAKNFLFSLEQYQQPDLPMQIANLTVEHILPRSEKHLDGNGWAEFDKRSHKESVHFLGNLTLLRENENKPGAKDNISYARKQKIFAKSSLELTNAIATRYPDWSPDIIVTRQKHMAKLAAKVWAINLPE